jgi:hypothetical protein
MWARIHKIDRVKPLADGGAIVLVEDERNVAAMSLVPSLSQLVAIARVLNAHRALELRHGGKGEVRYCAMPSLPEPLLEAVGRANANVYDARGETLRVPAAPAGVGGIVDPAFAALAYHTRRMLGTPDLPSALALSETRRRKSPLDKDAQPALYWTAVLELAALAGELSRSRGGRWVDTRDMPLPFALKFPDGAVAYPWKTAMEIVEGAAEVSLEVPTPPAS